MSTAANNQSKGSNIFPLIVIPVAFVLSVLIYMFVFGDASHFADIERKHPKPGDFLGIVYLGGPVVPVLMTLMFTVITFTIERFITLSKVSGRGSIDAFIQNIKKRLDNNDIGGAIQECDKQRGSVANVVRAGLEKYAQMGKESNMARDQKVLAIQKEVEEATTLELPMMEKNLSIIATISSVATLIGLLGTVLGMIRAFSALATSGQPDTSALSAGISEALINTALGIGSSAIAVIAYNYFTGKIDSMTYRIDEAGYTISQDFASKH